MPDWKKEPQAFPQMFHRVMEDWLKGGKEAGEGGWYTLGAYGTHEQAVRERRQWYIFRMSIRRRPAHRLFNLEMSNDVKTKIVQEGEMSFRLKARFLDRIGMLAEVYRALGEGEDGQ